MSRRLKLAFVIVSAVLGVAYLGKGFAIAFLQPFEGDRGRRWVEQQYVIRGQNPYDVAFRARAIEAGTAPEPSGRDDATAADLGVPHDVDYPPWAYAPGYVFFGPPRRVIRPWYATIQALAVAAVLLAAWRLGRGLAPLDRAVPVAALASMAATCTDLGTGNYATIILALALWAYRAEASGRPALGGLLLGVAQLKPNLAGPFLLVPLVRGRWIALVVAAAYLAVASGAIWAATATDPVEMCRQMVEAARRHVVAGPGPLSLAMGLGLPYQAALPLVAAACVGGGLLLMIERRRDDPLVLYAIASVVCRFWTYHLNYDNLILAFLVLALWRTAVETGRRSAWALFLLVTASLWPPGKAADYRAVQVAEHLAWLVGLAGLVVLRRSIPAPRPTVDEAPSARADRPATTSA